MNDCNRYKIIRISTLLSFLFIMALPTEAKLIVDTTKTFDVVELKCEYATNPIGLEAKTPQFGWMIRSKERGFVQFAYQIIVSDSKDALKSNQGNIWNSGQVESSTSTGILCKAPELKSRKVYYWKVRIWKNAKIVSKWSETASFEMGLLKTTDWNAEWIGYPFGWVGRVLYFRRVFSFTKEISRARAYVSGIGYYELRLNGRKVGDYVLDPATSDYAKSIYYTTYDIKEYLKKDNSMVLSVAPGWYGMPKMRMQLELNFADGTSETISSSSIRNVTTGPIISAGIIDGEFYDAREEKPEWDLPTDTIIKGIPNKHWGYAHVVEAPGGKMVSQQMEPIKVMEVMTPKSITQPFPNVFVVDVGQNLAGWAAIKVLGERGKKITMKFAETLSADGTVNQDNLRTAKATDTYILKGGGQPEQWEPSFTYHGFRYIQIEDLPNTPKLEDIQIKRVRSAVERSGLFNCSNELLNRINTMVLNTEASNLYSISTDCPQRDERMGWMNDMTVRIEEALYNFNLSRFYTKFINDVADTQDEEGQITDTAPYRVGGRPADPVSASYLLLAIKSYEFYGNKEIIRKHYKGLKAWVDFLNSRAKDGIVDYSYYGDWSPPAEFGVAGAGYGAISKNTPGILMSTGYLYYCSTMMSKMADILGNPDDKLKYADLATKVALAFNKKYWDEKTGGYGTNNQSCNSFALFIGVVSKDRIPRVIANLVENVKQFNYHLTTGNLCTKYLLETLTENGYPDVAYKIATQVTYPSWGFMLANGATTLWERWENKTGGSMNSHNHPMMGSVGSWLYKYVLGILPDIEHPGFEKFTIHPYLFKDLDSAEGEYNSVKGMIKSSWKKEKGKVLMSVTVPPNSIATVFVPTNNLKTITENNIQVNKSKNINFLRMEGQSAVFEVGSGTYNFKSK